MITVEKKKNQTKKHSTTFPATGQKLGHMKREHLSFQRSVHKSIVKLTFYLLHFNSKSFCSGGISTPPLLHPLRKAPGPWPWRTIKRCLLQGVGSAIRAQLLLHHLLIVFNAWNGESKMEIPQGHLCSYILQIILKPWGKVWGFF